MAIKKTTTGGILQPYLINGAMVLTGLGVCTGAATCTESGREFTSQQIKQLCSSEPDRLPIVDVSSEETRGKSIDDSGNITQNIALKKNWEALFELSKNSEFKKWINELGITHSPIPLSSEEFTNDSLKSGHNVHLSQAAVVGEDGNLSMVFLQRLHETCDEITKTIEGIVKGPDTESFKSFISNPNLSPSLPSGIDFSKPREITTTILNQGKEKSLKDRFAQGAQRLLNLKNIIRQYRQAGLSIASN